MPIGAASVRDTWLSVDGVRTRCLVAGPSAPPVLLLHGGGFDSASFSYGRTIGALSARWRVFAPDWPGYGLSAKPSLDYDLAYYVGFLGRLLDALGLERAPLVGISMGGGAALGLALRSPERVERLALVNSYGLGGETPYGRLGYILARAPLAAGLIYSLMRRSRRVLRWGLCRVVHDARVVTEELLDEARASLEESEVGRAFGTFRANEVGWGGLRTDFSDRLGEITTPTMIVHGERDRVVPVAWARRAHERIAGSELHVFSDCGHWPSRERPEEFNRVVGGFLARSRHGPAPLS